jgi:uncharacterized membrane protein YkoI
VSPLNLPITQILRFFKEYSVTHSIKVFAVASLAAAVGAAAFAANRPIENDALAAGKAKITLTQAVMVAEQAHAGGKASKAEFEHSAQFGGVYDVELVSGTKVVDVKVDAQKGVVLSSTDDKADADDDQDGAD